MAKIKIENIPVRARRIPTTDRTTFAAAVRDLQVGQSFVVDKLDGYDRIVLIAAKILLSAEFITRKEGNKVRIGRLV